MIQLAKLSTSHQFNLIRKHKNVTYKLEIDKSYTKLRFRHLKLIQICGGPTIVIILKLFSIFTKSCRVLRKKPDQAKNSAWLPPMIDYL